MGAKCRALILCCWAIAFPSQCVKVTEGALVGVRYVNTFFLRYKVNSSSKNVCRFVNPFNVDNGIQTLTMAPTRLLVLCMVDIVAEVEAGHVAISKLVIEGNDNGCLGLFGGFYWQLR